MNKKVLKTMIALVISFLVGLYVLKIFFPQEFLLVVENEKIVQIGNYIDSHKWAYYLFGVASSFFTYSVYCGAVCKKWILKWWHYLIILAVIGVNILLTKYDINLYTAFSIASFVVLPFIFKSDLKSVAICYSIHLFNQSLTLSIRDVGLYMKNMNSLTLNMVGLESFVWLLLLYTFFNYNKKEN